MNRREAIALIVGVCLTGKLSASNSIGEKDKVIITSYDTWFGQSLHGVTGTIQDVRPPLPELAEYRIFDIKLDKPLIDKNSGTRTDRLYMRAETLCKK